MDFSEIIVTIIISLVIIAINALGSKKKQEVKTSRENDLYKIPNPMRRPMNRGEKLGL